MLLCSLALFVFGFYVMFETPVGAFGTLFVWIFAFAMLGMGDENDSGVLGGGPPDTPYPGEPDEPRDP